LPAEKATVVAAAAVPVALKMTGLPDSPVTVACTVFVPAVAPSVHVVSAATPELLVVTVDPLTGDVVPLPAVVVNVTTTPCTGLLSASRTVTDGAVTVRPTVFVCEVDEPATMFCAVAAVLVPLNVTVVMAVAVAVTVFAAPAVRPNVQVESEATPELFDATVAMLAGLIEPAAAPEPPVAVSVKVTLKPETMLPCESLTITEGAATAEPMVDVCDVALLAVKLAATSAVPVAVKTTGLPLKPETAAWTVFVPAVVPSVQVVSAATPELFVVTVDPVTGDVVPLPAVVVKVTNTPWTGLLFASRTVTDGAVTVKPTVFVCEVDEPATMFCAVAAVLVPLNVTVVMPPAVAVTVFAAPAVRPNVQVESDATPELFEATVATLTGLIEPAAAPDPPVAVSVKVTLKPETTLPCESVTITDGAAMAEPTDAVCDVALLAVKLAATSAVPVAVNTTGLPERPATVAATVFAPAVVPSVHEVSAATPDALVVTVLPLTGEVVPLPAVVVKVTTTPEIGLLFASRTVTDGTRPAELIKVPTVAVCDVVVPDVGTMFWLVAAVLVPLNVTVVMAVAVAVTVFAAPAVRPNVQVESEATPELFDATVATLVGLIDPAAAPVPPVAVSV